MPALAEASKALPRLVPHCVEAEAGAGLLSSLNLPPASRAASGPVSRKTSDGMDRLAHDARNVLSGLMLYSELLATPGVLSPEHRHYAGELETITGSAAWLLEKILETSARDADLLPGLQRGKPAPIADPKPALPAATSVPLTPVPVTDAAAELRRLQPLLAAIAGPAVRLSVATMPCTGRTTLAVEDLSRVLVNLVRNAADAMPGGGHIGVAVQYCRAVMQAGSNPESVPATALNAAPRGVILTVSDDGPGIPEALREQVFSLGFSTRTESAGWAAPYRRGTGLSIVRELVENEGGTVRAAASHTGGARFEIVLPFNEVVTSGTCTAPPSHVFSADSGEEG